MSTRTANAAKTASKPVVKSAAKTGTRRTSTPKPAAAPKTQKSVTLTFDHEKDTPGTFRYAEQGEKDALLVGTLYTKKAATLALFGKQPKGYKVTIEPIF